MVQVIQLVLFQELLDLRHALFGNVADDQMLVRRESEMALVDFSNFADTGLEVAVWLVLDTTVLNKAGEVVEAVVALDPAEVIDVAVEEVRTGWLEFVAKELLDFSLEHVKTHTIDGVLETSILEDKCGERLS